MKKYFKSVIMPSAHDTTERLVMDFVRFVDEMLVYRDTLYIALSGGSTPQLMFDILASGYSTAVKWNKLHFFWVDERCVPQNDKESNYGNANRILFSKVNIPQQNIHPIMGQDDPFNEVVRYTGDILAHVPCLRNYPVFDLIFLGMGNDGHTASIFPGNLNLFNTNAICSVSEYPQNHQKRITLTGKVLNNASYVIFLVTGKDKAETVKSIFTDEIEASGYPAKRINPTNGELSWYLDNEAYSLAKVK